MKQDKDTLELRGSSVTKLLARTAPEGYLEEWTHLLMKEKSTEGQRKETSVLVFRLYNEWVALPTVYFREVVEYRKIHVIPHRSNAILLGTVNLRGQLKLCVSLHNLLEIEPTGEKNVSEVLLKHDRMLSIEKEGEKWVFPSDDIFGIVFCDYDKLSNIPVTATKSKANYLKGIFEWENGMRIGIIEEELLFFSLRRSI